HQEPGKKCNRGLKPKELKKQFTKERPLDCPAATRIAELTVSKVEQAVKMIKGAVKAGFIPDYVLADSWFIADGFIKSVLSLRTKKRGDIHILGLMKSNRKLLYKGRDFRADVLPGLLAKQIKQMSPVKVPVY